MEFAVIAAYIVIGTTKTIRITNQVVLLPMLGIGSIYPKNRPINHNVEIDSVKSTLCSYS